MIWVPESEYKSLQEGLNANTPSAPYTSELSQLYMEIASLLHDKTTNAEQKVLKFDQLFKRLQNLRHLVEEHPINVVVKNFPTPPPPPPIQNLPQKIKAPSPPPPPVQTKSPSPTPPKIKSSSPPKEKTPPPFPTTTKTPTIKKEGKKPTKSIPKRLQNDDQVKEIISYVKQYFPNVVDDQDRLVGPNAKIIRNSNIESAIRYMVNSNKKMTPPPGVKLLNDLDIIQKYLNKDEYLMKGSGFRQFAIEKWKF